MANEFGASHRQLVKDTNDGNVAPAPSATTTSISMSGRNTTNIGSSNKSAITQGLLNVGQDVLGKMKKRKDEVDYAEGYSRGLEEGYAETQESPIMDTLFGKGATLRGAQDKIIENDSRQWLNMKLKALDGDSKSMDEDEYMEYLSGELRAAAEVHDDPEVRASIMMMAGKQFETLARNHTVQRQSWIAMTNDAAVRDTIEQSVTNMKSAQKYGDLKSQREAQDWAEVMFDQPLDMEPDRWLQTTNSVIIEQLGRGDDLAYRMAEAKGIVSMMTPTEKAKLNVAQEIFAKKHNRNFFRDQAILDGRIKDGTATDAEIKAHQAKYPSVDTNAIRDKKLKVDSAMADVRREQAEATDAIIAGDVAIHDYTDKQQKVGMEQAFQYIADDGLRAMRDEAIENGKFTGDPNAPFTQQQRMEYMLDNPMKFAQQWAQHPELKTPVLQNLASTVSSTLRKEQLTEPEVQMLDRQMKALKTFQNVDGGNFHNQFRSEAEAGTYEVYSFLVNDSGWEPINAVRELRTIEKLPEIELADYAETIEDGISEMEEDFLDMSPESQGFMGLYNKTPDNEQAFQWELKDRLKQSMLIYKGDINKALPAAKATIRRNAIVSNGQFIPNGRKMQIKGGTLEEFMRGVNADDAIRAQITNAGRGFAADLDYTTAELSYNPFNPKTVTMHSRHDATGMPITINLNLPQRGSDFSTYGINSWTGYNPKIADTDERREAFIRNNRVIRAYKTIGKAADKAATDIME